MWPSLPRHVVTRTIQDADAVIDPDEKIAIAQADAERDALSSFEAVFTDGGRITLDHHLIYYARE